MGDPAADRPRRPLDTKWTAAVCGDEVPCGKPAPDPYLRATVLLGESPDCCLAIEDSVNGTASAVGAGCRVLVVLNDVDVPRGPRRRHVGSLAELDVAALRSIYAELDDESEERTA